MSKLKFFSTFKTFSIIKVSKKKSKKSSLAATALLKSRRKFKLVPIGMQKH